MSSEVAFEGVGTVAGATATAEELVEGAVGAASGATEGAEGFGESSRRATRLVEIPEVGFVV